MKIGLRKKAEILLQKDSKILIIMIPGKRSFRSIVNLQLLIRKMKLQKAYLSVHTVFTVNNDFQYLEKILDQFSIKNNPQKAFKPPKIFIWALSLSPGYFKLFKIKEVIRKQGLNDHCYFLQPPNFMEEVYPFIYELLKKRNALHN